MQNQRRIPGRGAAEPPRTPTGRRDLDVNRERMVFCLTSLVGHRVTAKLRNNIMYEGNFHSCSLDGDYSITLKSARQVPTCGAKSGEVIGTLLIPGKDFLQVSAIDVPPPAPDAEIMAAAGVAAGAGFATDAEIGAKKAVKGERELVPWATAGTAEAPGGVSLALDERAAHGDGSGWDQFGQNEQMFGVMSTYNEELYTTKLDPNSLPREKREEADRIAREIESGAMASAVDSRLEDGEDEDHDMPGGSSVPLTEEHLSQHESLTDVVLGVDAFSREHRTKRGMITAHSPMHSPLIAEMKRINALNLEPALPKLDDKTRNDWINFKQSQNRTAATKTQGNGLKMEFQQSLEVINQREKQREKLQAQAATTDQADQGVRQRPKPSDITLPNGATSSSGAVGATPSSAKSSFAFNANAKEFSFNPQAATFTPGGSNNTHSALTPQANKNSGPAPTFHMPMVNQSLARESLQSLLTVFFDRACGVVPAHSPPDWAEAAGPSYHEVLGKPNPANPAPAAGMPGQGMPGGWQQQAMMPGGSPVAGGGPGGPGVGPPQMGPPQGFMVPANSPGGQQQPMYPMYGGPGQGGCPNAMQRPQNGGNMQQQPMVFNQQGMMHQPSQSMNMPSGMAGGQNPGVMPMVMQGQGQYPQPGYAAQQAMQGQGQGQGPGPGQMQRPQNSGNMPPQQSMGYGQ